MAAATDLDLPPNPLTFSLDPGAPEGITLDQNHGAFTWTPAEAQGLGVYPITLRVTDDGIPPLSATQTFAITVNEVNASPVLTDFAKTDPTNASLAFSLADFTAHFSDHDGDLLTMLQITTLPEEGTLALNGIPVTIGQEIPAAGVDRLVFTPAPGWQGTVTFTWNASDGTVYASTLAR